CLSAAAMMMKMMKMRRLLLVCVFCALSVSLCSGACAEVDSDTEAVAGEPFKLGCISCKMRGEVEASATVDWLFKARGEADFVHIYSYDGEASSIIDERFQDRMEWHGSKKTFDLQDASVDLLNVTFNDSGVYRCIFNRVLSYEHYEFSTIATKLVPLTVVAKGTTTPDICVSITVFSVSTLFVLQTFFFNYRKYLAEYLAIASESKDNCAGVQVAE
uniref:Sodium channel regulatory subunit beta-1 n=1 Tax=Sinocyclocheilus grahami TaxID=75366 RepID=A0A672KQH2_SINGR